MVLAAGYGSRLRPLTQLLPKPLVPVANRPLIHYILAQLQKAAVVKVAINLHHLAHLIPEALGDGSAFGLELTYSKESEILGTGGGVSRMRSFLQDGPFLLLNGDILTGVDLQSVLQTHRRQGAAATMVVRPLPTQASFTPLAIDEENWLVRFKHARQEARGKERAVMFCGIHVLEPTVFDFLPASGFSCINDEAYTAMIAAGLKVATHVYQGPWFDLGTPAAYLEANRMLLSAKICLPQLDPLAGQKLQNAVLLGHEVMPGENVELGPEVAIGDGSVLGEGARVARSVLWPGSRVAAKAVLDRVILAGSHIVRVPKN